MTLTPRQLETLLTISSTGCYPDRPVTVAGLYNNGLIDQLGETDKYELTEDGYQCLTKSGS